MKSERAKCKAIWKYAGEWAFMWLESISTHQCRESIRLAAIYSWNDGNMCFEIQIEMNKIWHCLLRMLTWFWNIDEAKNAAAAVGAECTASDISDFHAYWTDCLHKFCACYISISRRCSLSIGIWSNMEWNLCYYFSIFTWNANFNYANLLNAERERKCDMECEIERWTG